jgi:hypothetical protein
VTSIPEEMIMNHLNWLLSTSEPGAAMHHLDVVAAPRDAFGPFGLPDEKALHGTMYALAFTPTKQFPDLRQFITASILSANAEHTRRGDVPLFAALSQEAFIVETQDYDARAIQLRRQGRLQDHPDAAEVTMVYGVCTDGRRWRGRRWLTGPKAGQTGDTDLIVGRPTADEGFGFGPVLRRMVGMAG